MPLATLLDLAKQRNSDGNPYVEIIDETFKMIPEVSGMAFDPNTGLFRKMPNVGGGRTIDGTTYEAKVWTTLPTVGFRNVNEGSDYTKGESTNRTFSTRIMNPKWAVDAIVESDRRFAEMLAEQAMFHTMAVNQKLGSQFYYGVGAVDDKGFPGLCGMYDATNYMVDATGSANKSSVWFVKFGMGGVEWLWGNNLVGILPQVPRKGDYTDGNGKTFTAWIQESYVRPGLKLGSPQSAVRIKNVGTASGKTLTWAHMRSAWQLMASKGVIPDAIFMSPRSQEQLQNESVTAEVKNPPLPTNHNGVPIIPTNSISNAETV